MEETSSIDSEEEQKIVEQAKPVRNPYRESVAALMQELELQDRNEKAGGKRGTYKNHFTPEQEQFLSQAIQTQYCDRIDRPSVNIKAISASFMDAFPDWIPNPKYTAKPQVPQNVLKGKIQTFAKPYKHLNDEARLDKIMEDLDLAKFEVFEPGPDFLVQLEAYQSKPMLRKLNKKVIEQKQLLQKVREYYQNVLLASLRANSD